MHLDHTNFLFLFDRTYKFVYIKSLSNYNSFRGQIIYKILGGGLKTWTEIYTIALIHSIFL